MIATYPTGLSIAHDLDLGDQEAQSEGSSSRNPVASVNPLFLSAVVGSLTLRAFLDLQLAGRFYARKVRAIDRQSGREGQPSEAEMLD